MQIAGVILFFATIVGALFFLFNDKTFGWLYDNFFRSDLKGFFLYFGSCLAFAAVLLVSLLMFLFG